MSRAPGRAFHREETSFVKACFVNLASQVGREVKIRCREIVRMIHRIAVLARHQIDRDDLPKRGIPENSLVETVDQKGVAKSARPVPGESRIPLVPPYGSLATAMLSQAGGTVLRYRLSRRKWCSAKSM
jgi:hypothetical protein